MKYVVNDRVNGKQIFETEAEALVALPAAQNSFLEREDYRFCWAFVETYENNTTWRNVTDADPEYGDYKVFNQYTGQYETFSTKSEAKLKIQELKNQFILDVQLDKVYEYIPPVPRTTIPVEVL